MPNWCENSMEITGPVEKLRELRDAVLNGELFSRICPQPDSLSSDTPFRVDQSRATPDWYLWRLANWGTKWDVHPADVDSDFSETDNGQARLAADFLTAWSPPVGV